MSGGARQERSITLPDGMWCGRGATNILDSLEGELAGRGGLVVITGAIGVGKSLLLDCYSKSVKKEEQVFYFMSGGELREIDFFNVLASGLGIQGLYTEKLQFIVTFTNYLHSLAARGQKLTLVIDDCELLSQNILDVLRLIVQVEKDGSRLVQLILVGRRKFGQVLAEHRNASLLSCLIHKSILEPFSQQETAEYISYRLELAGYSTGLFGFNSLHLIHRATGGRVGEINRLCEHVLQQPLGKDSCYDIATLCVSIDALNMEMGEPEDQDDAVLPIAATTQESAPAKEKIPWEEAVQAAARNELRSDLEAVTGVEENVWVGKILQAIKTKKWWTLSVPSLAVLGLCVYFVTPSVGSKENVKSPEVVVEGNLLQEKGDVTPQTSQEGMVVKPAKLVAPKIIEAFPEQVAGGQEIPTPQPVFAIDEDVARNPKSPPVPMIIVEQTPIVVVEQQDEVSAVIVEPEEEVVLPEQIITQVLRLRAGNNALTSGAKSNLRKFLGEAEAFPQAQIIVRGYVSSDTVSQENTEISVKRANVVRDLLIAKGLLAERIRVVGMGVQNPVASNSTVSGRNKNRRAVLELLPKEYVENP